MFFRIIFKSISVNINKTLIVLLSVALGASIICAFSSIYFDINTKMSKELRTFGANFFLGASNPDEFDYIKFKDYEEVANHIKKDELIGSTGLIYGIVRLDLGNAIISGINFQEAKKINPFWQVEGSWINVDFDDKNCMIGKSLAKKMELNIGSYVTVQNNDTDFSKKLQVKGIIETGQAEDDQIFVNLSFAQKILGKENLINYAIFSIQSDADEMNVFAQKINEKNPNIQGKPIRKISYSEGKILNKIKGLMALIAIMILAITTMCVNATLIASVMERSREIGLQKALGATNKYIAKQFLIEITFISFLAIILGLIIGYILAQIMGAAIFDSGINMRIQVIPITFIISYLASILAALLPIKKILNISPAQVLRGE